MVRLLLSAGVRGLVDARQCAELLRTLRCSTAEQVREFCKLLRTALQSAHVQRRLPPGAPPAAAHPLDANAASAAGIPGRVERSGAHRQSGPGHARRLPPPAETTAQASS